MIQLIQEREQGSRPVAVIDIGSNSIRLVVYERADRSPTPLYQDKVMCGLGKHLSSTRKLNPDSIGEAIASLGRFRELARICGVRDKDLHPFATAAVRWAEDGPQFLKRAEETLGGSIEVIDNQQEAELSATGVQAGFQSPTGVVGDLGGGSLELIRMGQDGFQKAVSLPLGGLALIDRAKGDKNRSLTIIEETMAPLGWLAECHGQTFFAVGGTWRALAKLHMRQTGHPLTAVHAYRLSANKALQITSRYANYTASALAKMEGMTSGREETLPLGALLLNVILHKLQPSEVVFSAFGVREGYLFRLLGDAERVQDPLLEACEALAKQQSRSFQHAKELTAWTDTLFQSLRETALLPRETDEDVRLRHAACLLSDIAWRAHPDYRGEQSAALVAQSAFVGIDHPGRAFLALCVYHRYERKISGETLTKLSSLIRGKLERRALIIGQIVRLAHALSAGMAGVLPHISFKMQGDKLVLELPQRFSPLASEMLTRRLKAVAKELGNGSEIRILPAQEAPKPTLLRGFLKRAGED